jgi:hypothetical protein
MILRPLKMSDVGSLMGIFSDLEAKRHYPGPKSRSEAEDREDLVSEGLLPRRRPLPPLSGLEILFPLLPLAPPAI